MKSHLTRQVFRRLLLSQPVVQHRPLHQLRRLRPQSRHGRPHSSTVPVRTFFGIFQQQPQRDIREPRLDPGMEKMLELDKRLHLTARLPPAPELKRAFKDFIQAKANRKQALEDFHITQLLQTLKAIEGADVVDGQRWLEKDDLIFALNVLKERATEYTKMHNLFARELFAALRNHNDFETMDAKSRQAAVSNFARILSYSGDAREARDTLKQFESKDLDTSGMWIVVLSGFCEDSNEPGVVETLQMMEERRIPRSRRIHRVMCEYYARKNDVVQTKGWFRSELVAPPTSEKDGPTLRVREQTFSVLLEFCLRNGEMEWGHSVLAGGGNVSDEKHVWNAIFRAAAASGKSVDEIDQMMNVVVRRAREEGHGNILPEIDVFNGLISFAISRNDAYTAERYYALAEKWGVTPSVRTHILRVEYRLAAGDIAGAQAAYARLREETVEDNEDWSIMNRLLRVLLEDSNISNDTILSLIDDISERRRTFPPDTVVALCDYHLHRDEYFEVVDLLQTYAYQYSTADRIRMRDHLVTFTLDLETDTGSAWDTYMIFHQIFDLETQRDIRNQVMTLMFDRGRPDLASHVFTRMSKHPRADTRPNVETYVRAFEGIAKTQEADALEVIHNLLKLDTETEPCTRLYNALMLAYSSCDVPWRALEFWEQIAVSDEGPSYESLHIAFRACERAPFGYRKAKSIWSQLRQADAEITREMFASYVGALAGQQLFDDLVDEVKRMPQTVVGGGRPDDFTIGTIFNASMGVNNQLRIETWARKDYPNIWKQLEQRGIEEDVQGLRQVNGIDRSLRA